MAQALKKPVSDFPLSASKKPERIARKEKEMRENLTEKQIDKTLQDSFPSSDPPSWY